MRLLSIVHLIRKEESNQSKKIFGLEKYVSEENTLWDLKILNNLLQQSKLGL